MAPGQSTGTDNYADRYFHGSDDMRFDRANSADRIDRYGGESYYDQPVVGCRDR